LPLQKEKNQALIYFPLARIIINKKVGDKVTFKQDRKDVAVGIVEVSYP
jgi:transcription elongation GreA/GreB family factor